MDDFVQENEDNPQVDESGVNSMDFAFNIANIYDTSQDISNKQDHPSDKGSNESSYSGSDLDISIMELLRRGNNESSDDPSIQLFSMDEIYSKAVHVMFTQMFVQKGMKLFGEKAVAAMFKELKQLSDGVVPGKPVVEPIPFEHLNDEDKREALEAVNLIAQKRCGRIKGRTCANGA